MNDKDDRKRKLYILIVVALLIAFLAFSLAQNAQNTADNNANITNVFAPVPNNTNLAPDFSGIDPTVPFGTGERVQNVTYNASNYSLDLHVFAHAMSVSDTASVKVYIDGVLVSPRSGRPLAAAETAYRGVDITIPKNSSYLVNITNYHHYEWREYPILSGRNGTLSINQTFITNGSNYNASYVPYNGANQNITVSKDYFSIISADSNSTITIPNASKGGILLHQEGNPAFGTTENTSVSLDGIISLRTYDNTVNLNSSYTESVTEHIFKINNIEVAAINKTGLNVTNLTAERINMFVAQGVVTASRAFGTVYMNQGNKTIFVSVSGYSLGNAISMTASTDSASPPVTVVNQVHSPSSGLIGSFSFMVLPGNRYRVTTTGAGPVVNSWVEWS